MTLSILAVAATAIGTWIVSRRFSVMVLLIALVWGGAAHGVVKVELPASVIARLEAREAKQADAREKFLCERNALSALQQEQDHRFDDVQRQCQVAASPRDDYAEEAEVR